jgi:hypothetical protein
LLHKYTIIPQNGMSTIHNKKSGLGDFSFTASVRT